MNENRTGAAPGTAAERRRARARKRLLALGVGCAVLALLAGGILLLNAANARRTAEEEAAAAAAATANIPLDVLPADGAAALSFTDADGRALTFEKDADGRWTLAGDAACPVNSDSVQLIANTAAALKAYESFAPVEALSGYGLENPVQTVTLTDAAGNVHTLQLGAQNTATERQYLRMDGGEQLYTVPATLYSACSVRLTDLMGKEALPVFNSNHITGVAVQDPGKEPLVFSLSGEQDNGVNLWTAAQGEEAVLVDTATGVTVMDRLASLSYNSAVAWKPESLEKYGLDEAQRSTVTVAYTVTDADGVSVSDSLTLYVGYAAETGHYAQAQGHSAVYLITSAKVEGLLDAAPADFAPIQP